MQTDLLTIKAYLHDGRQLLGTCDGQGVLRRSPRWHLTALIRRLQSRPRRCLSLGGRVHEYRVVDASGAVLLTIRPDDYPPPCA